jgi:hypothetical protein
MSVPGDPLLDAVDDVVVALEAGGRADVRHVAAGPRLRDRQANVFLTLYHRPYHL